MLGGMYIFFTGYSLQSTKPQVKSLLQTLARKSSITIRWNVFPAPPPQQIYSTQKHAAAAAAAGEGGHKVQALQLHVKYDFSFLISHAATCFTHLW